MPTSESIFRVDKFIVPDTAREAFLERASETHALLDTLDGCLYNVVLEQVAGPGTFNFVTIVEWESAEALENARAILHGRYAETGFDPQAFISKWDITADMANYSAYGGPA
jgi:quinol monooxygenase YgiN